MLAPVHPDSGSHDALPVCLSKENPNRLVSLWDIVNQFKAADFCLRVGNLAVFEARFQHENPSKLGVEGWAQLSIEFAGQIIHAANDCYEVGLTHAWDEIDRVNSGLQGSENDANANVIAARHIRHRSEEHTSELQSLRHLVC